MTKLFSFAAFIAIGAVVAASLPSLFAAPAPGSWSNAEKAYATANLELAKARLALAQEQKQAVGDSVSQSTLDALESGVQLAELRVQQLGNRGSSLAPQIAAASAELKGLQSDYNDALEANKVAAGSVSKSELRNQLAEVKVAEARVMALKALANQPVEVRIQWQIGQLQDQIRALWARPLIED